MKQNLIKICVIILMVLSLIGLIIWGMIDYIHGMTIQQGNVIYGWDWTSYPNGYGPDENYGLDQN